MKKQNEFPPISDEERVQSIIAHYEQQMEGEAETYLFLDNFGTSDIRH